MNTETVIVTAMVRPQLEARVVQALHDLPNFPGFFITRVHGQGRGSGTGGAYVSSEEELSYNEFVKLEVACDVALADVIYSEIVKAAWTGRRGDGIVFKTPAFSLSRIRDFGASSREAPK